jgi:hypothetical protein
MGDVEISFHKFLGSRRLIQYKQVQDNTNSNNNFGQIKQKANKKANKKGWISSGKTPD